MLSGYLFNQQKIILIKDQLGLDHVGERIVEIWLKDGMGPDASLASIRNLEEPGEDLGKFRFARVSKLLRGGITSELFYYVDFCKFLSNVKYLFLWATEKNLSESFLVPYLEHQSEVIVTLEDERHLSILVKKAGGSVSVKHLQYQLHEGKFSTKELKKSDRSKEAPVVPTSSIDPASLGTFKMGDRNKEEQQAKEALTLPFEFIKTTADGGRVFYHPDAKDDLDEEDPDDDLLL